VGAAALDGHGGKIERFAIDQTVDGEGEEFAELAYVDVGQGECGLGVVEAGAGVVVVVGEDLLGVGAGSDSD
jgi:hypothetical protein